MTSLAKQLERLAVPHTQTIYGEDQRKKSLLFDPSEAASIDKETFYNLGINGLEELETIDASFQEYESNLFAESSMSFERSVQSSDVNDRLNETLSQFLLHLSPYCLLKPAHKALEWLIYRYHIHQYNVDELVMCVLPYHESKTFVRVIQLLPLDAKTASKWDWLKQIQKSGVHLAKMTLVNHCRTNHAFLSTVCDMVYKSVKVHIQYSEKLPHLRTLFSFFTTTVIGVLDSEKVKEELVSTLLAHISHGLRSKILDYKAASYMIMAQLLFKAKLQKTLLETLMNGMCKHLSAQLLQEAVSCLLLMFQTQDISKLTNRAFKHLCRQTTLVDCLAHMTTSFKADSLIQTFLLKLIPCAVREHSILTSSGNSSDSDSGGGVPQYLSQLYTLMSTASLSQSTTKLAIREIVQSYVRYWPRVIGEEEKSDFNRSLRSIVRLLEGRYYTALDEAVEEVLKETKNDAVRDIVKAFLHLSVGAIQDDDEESSGMSLLLLNHQNCVIRRETTQRFMKNISNMEESDFVSDTLMARLQDDDVGVVLAVLSPKENIWKFVKDQTKLFEVLYMLNTKREQEKFKKTRGKGEWKQVELLSLELMCKCPKDFEDKAMATGIRYFFTVGGDQIALEMCNCLMMSPVGKQSSVLQKFGEITKDYIKSVDKLGPHNRGGFNLAVVRNLGKCMADLDKDEVLDLIDLWSSNWKLNRTKCLVLLLVDYLLENNNCTLDLCVRQMDFIQRALMQDKEVEHRNVQETILPCSLEDAVNEVYKYLNNQKGLIEEFTLMLLHRTIEYIGRFKSYMPETNFWRCCDDKLDSDKDKLTVLLVKTFNLLLKSTSVSKHFHKQYRELLLKYTKEIYPDILALLRILGLMWTQHCNPDHSVLKLTVITQASALQIGNAHLLNVTPEQIKVITSNFTPVLMNLMVAMTSPHQGLRDSAVGCVVAMGTMLKETDHEMLPLVKKLIRCQPEILADSNYVSQVLSSVFKDCDKESTMETPRKKRKSVTRNLKAKALDMIVAIIVAMETPAFIQRAALELLQGLETQKLLQDLFPLLTKLMADIDSDNANNTKFDCVRLILQRFSHETASLLPSGGQGLQLFTKALQTSSGPDDSSTTVQLCALGQIDKILYKALSEESQRAILTCLIDVWVGTESHVVSGAVRKVIKQLPLESADVVEELQSCWKATSTSANTVKETKRRKRQQAETDEEFNRPGWRRATMILEGIHEKKRLANCKLLLPVCFQLLTRVLDSDQHSSAEYIKQLILSLVNHICVRIQSGEEEKEAIKEEKFNMELIVQTIRTSSNPQTHNQALLVLTTAARLYPEHLLHNVMSVFTFMGANILRQDDAYSIEIIGRILENVIPALITACEQRTKVPRGVSNKVEDVITMVIRVFVDAYSHIPDHRRLMLFTKLVKIVGDDLYLWRTLLLLVAHLVTRGTQSSDDTPATEREILSKDMEFCLQLSGQFSVTTQLEFATAAIKYLGELPDDKTEEKLAQRVAQPHSLGKLRKEDTEIYNVKVHSAKQLRHFKYKVVELLISLYTNQVYIVQVSNCKDASLLIKFKGLLQTILEFLSKVSKATDTYQETITARFWRAFQHKVYDLLEKVVTLLPEDMFVEVVSSLMDHSLPNVQRKALELLNTNLHQKRVALTKHEVSLLLPLVDKTRGIIERTCLVAGGVEETIVNAQTALYGLKLLCRHLGENNPHTFIKVLKLAVRVFSERGDNLQLSACALLCIAEISQVLRIHVIAHLSSFMPQIITCLENHDTLLTNELFLMSVVTTLQKVVENLSNFLSPYIKDIILQVCCLSALDTELDVMKKPQTQQRLKNTRSSLSTVLPFRVMLPSVSNCFENFSNNDLMCVKPLMSLLEDHIANMSRDDLTSNLPQLQAFFLVCLDFRAKHPDVEESDMTLIEGSIMQTIISMVMKLSESTFRPFLLKLYDWGTRESDIKARVTVFYRLAQSLAEKLKSLFTLFAGHFVQHAADLLDLNNSSKTGKGYFGKGKQYRRMSHQLLVHVIDCLQKCFLYDTEGFLNKERFDCLMQPLVDQLDNIGRSENLYRKRVDHHLVPCLVQMAVAIQDDSLWKTLNYQILLKTRHEEPKVRLGALNAVDELHKKLGEDYLGLLPETIPFLAELMEDECEEVEKECQAVIGEMEKTLGEPLQKYF
ncbi:HEAT repeat-containing protein 1-like [Mizuhopecten yessoensis]|uniref:HEAT repeat-containing protein 1 n=1 Tax=Mizuhopecten yessoensis TaxID=6573 RepID=A0A210PNP6_MIZYE|nr:HEAT repeat-containing protein 1-like [Mizuhopecten yessoensis]XP_021378910.1 HEAT repeat-containing protein 1-like [Mizuhopecten yessoensis]OWF38112.1 HEAT repeat-containing protein 1 [Mizuhopecten yessoensis]